MDNVPDFLIETIDIISKGFSSHKELMKEEIEKEMQHVLNISAQAKEVVANLLPEHEFDEDFAHAYMEDYERSDTLCVFDDDEKMEDNSRHSGFRSAESIGEIEFSSPVSMKGRSGMEECTQMEPVILFTPHLLRTQKNSTINALGKSRVEETDIVHQQSRSGNEYLALQEACDITSLLDTLAKTEVLELYQGDKSYLKSYTSVPEEFSDTLASKFSEMWKNVLQH